MFDTLTKVSVPLPISNINVTFSLFCHSANLVAQRKFGYLKRKLV